MKVIIAGATGLVGSACVAELLRHPEVSQVLALVRRPWPEAPVDPRLHVATVEFGALAGSLPADMRADAVICALGTTMRQAGSEDAFRRVDHDFPVALATIARSRDVPHFLLVSALGAASGSRVFYNRVKGDTEAAILALGFPRLTIVRPSLLVGARRELRIGEVVGMIVGVLAPPRWRPVKGTQVAAVLVHHALHPVPGVHVLENADIRSLEVR